jgi:hypothetical protein
MKNIFIITMSLCGLYACSPATEKRETMDRIAKRIGDSIELCLDSALNDPLIELAKTEIPLKSN